MYKLVEYFSGNVAISGFSACKFISVDKEVYHISDLDNLDQRPLSIPKFTKSKIIGDLIFVYHFKEKKTVIFNKKDFQEIMSINGMIYFLSEDNNFFYLYQNSHTLKMHKCSYKIQSIECNDISALRVWVEGIRSIRMEEGGQIMTYCQLTDDSIEAIWQVDLVKDVFPDFINVDGMRIFSIDTYNGDFIVSCDAGFVRLCGESGEVKWKYSDGKFRRIVIGENIGYISNGVRLSRIDLLSGIVKGYGREDDWLPELKYNGKNYLPRCGNYTYHDGLLWTTINISGQFFVAAINPRVGKIVWVESIDAVEGIDAMGSTTVRFYKDKMYVDGFVDSDNYIMVYEKIAPQPKKSRGSFFKRLLK